MKSDVSHMKSDVSQNKSVEINCALGYNGINLHVPFFYHDKLEV